MNGITNIEYGLDWYDIQARQYDAIGVPGWNAIDPLSEKYYSISPYAYCGGNPVNFGENVEQLIQLCKTICIFIIYFLPVRLVIIQNINRKRTASGRFLLKFAL